MGIENLYTFLYEYYNEVLSKRTDNYHSDICYIDCTSKIYSILNSSYNKIKGRKKFTNNQDIYILIDEILDHLAENISRQIKENKFYKRYILLFDVTFDSTTEFIDLNEKLLYYYKKYEDLTQFDKKEKAAATCLIPKLTNLHTVTLQNLHSLVKNASDVRWSYWNTTRDITDYVSVSWLMRNVEKEYKLYFKKNIQEDLKNVSKLTIEKQNKINIYKKLQYANKIGFQHYLMKRGLKRFATKKERYPFKDEVVNSYFKDKAEVFSDTFFKHYYKIEPQMLVELVPNLVYKIQILTESIDKDIEYLGCEYEADFVIKQHIKYYNLSNKQVTVSTTDTDLLLLLSDIDCLVKIKGRRFDVNDNVNLLIKPKEFWEWVTKKKNIRYKNLVALAVRLGSTYNCLKNKFSIYNINEVRRCNFEIIYEDLYANLLDELDHMSSEIEYIKLQIEELKSHTEEDNRYKIKELKEFKSKKEDEFKSYLQMFGALEKYIQADHIEKEFHYIKGERELNINKINDRYTDIFTQFLIPYYN